MMKRAVILASGPSLNSEDIKVCRLAGWPVIAVNNSWEIFPDCNIIYGGDYEWWKVHHRKIKSDAALWSCNQRAVLNFNLNYHQVSHGTYNSGQRAIELAIRLGAKKIILLGYDCSLSQGSHWHGQHEATRNPTIELLELWKKQFNTIAEKFTDIDIVNCSRASELACFRRGILSEELALE